MVNKGGREEASAGVRRVTKTFLCVLRIACNAFFFAWTAY